MKKVITLILIFVMMFLCSTALADDVAKYKLQRHGLSDDKIMEMYQLTVEEMERRGLSPFQTEGVTVPPGLYKIGVDIPQGVYRLEFPDDDYDYGFITLFNSNNEQTHFLSVGKLNNVQVFGKLELVNGMSFQLIDTTAVFYPYTGLF